MKMLICQRAIIQFTHSSMQNLSADDFGGYKIIFELIELWVPQGPTNWTLGHLGNP